jgi:hypothetical protein
LISFIYIDSPDIPDREWSARKGSADCLPRGGIGLYSVDNVRHEGSANYFPGA